MRDEADFDWWYRTVYSGVARTVFLIVHDRGCAEEITQDAFLQMLRHWTRVRGYERPDAWVRRVAIRLAVKHVQREQKRGRRERLAMEPVRESMPHPEVARAIATTLRFANPSEVNPDEAAIVSLLTEGTFTRIMP